MWKAKAFPNKRHKKPNTLPAGISRRVFSAVFPGAQTKKALPAGNIELKAVVTPHNKSWKVGDLFEELEKAEKSRAVLKKY